MAINIYFANDLFNEATRNFNKDVVNRIREVYGDKVYIYNPMDNDEINDKESYANSQMIANADYRELKKSDLLIAILDNQDFGVGIEIGIAYEAEIPIIGLYSDVRQFGGDHPMKIKALMEIGENQYGYSNLMGNGLIKNNGKLVNSSEELVKMVGDYLEELR